MFKLSIHNQKSKVVTRLVYNVQGVQYVRKSTD